MRSLVKLWLILAVLYLPCCFAASGQPSSVLKRQAANEISARQFPEALSLLKDLLKRDPRDASLWILQGLALDGVGQTTQSLASFDHALALNRTYLPALEGAAQTAYLRRRPEASRYVARLLAADPHNMVAHAMAGALAYLDHHCPLAISHFEEAGEVVIGSPNALSEFSDCLLKADKVPEAIDVLSRGLQRHSDNLQLAYNLGVAQLAAHDPSKAIDALISIHDPQDGGYLNLLAEAYAEADRPDDAFRTLNQAIAIQPDAERNYLDLAILCLEHHKENLTVSAASAGISKIQNAASLYLIRGVAYAQLGQYKDAESDFATASKLEPDQAHGTIAMSLLLSDRNQVEQEKQLLLRQAKRTPTDAVTNYLLADLLIRQGAAPRSAEFDEAKRYLAVSLRSKPDSVEAQVLMGKLLEDEDDPAGALEHLQAALKVEPTNRTALYRSFVLLQKLHRKDEANQVLKQLKGALEHDLKKGGAGGQIKVDQPQ